MEEHCSTGQSPQWAVVPMKEEEEEEKGNILSLSRLCLLVVLWILILRKCRSYKSPNTKC